MHNAFDNLCRYSPDDTTVWYVFCHDGTGSNNRMTANRYAWQNNRIGTNPDIIANNHLFCGNSLFVNTLGSIFKVVVQCRDCDTLSQIDVTADGYWTDNCTMQSDAGMVANDDITHSIVDAGIGFDNATPSE